MRYIFLIVLLLHLHSAFGQQEVNVTPTNKKESNDSKKTKEDKKPYNIADYSDLLNLKLFMVNKTNLVTHHDGLSNRYFEYKPNESLNLGFGINYRWLGLDMAFNFPFINDDDVLYGKTQRLDIQSNIYLHKFVIDFNFQFYEGYYESNRHANDPNHASGYPIRPDMATVNLGLTAFYIFNHEHFSYRAAFLFNERQVKSAGSFIAGTYINMHQMNADSTLVPAQFQNEVDSTADFREVGYANMGLSAGYAHTFIIYKKFFLSLTVAVGLGVRSANRQATDELPEYHNSGQSVFVVGRTSLGYNGEKWYAGFSSVNSAATSPDENNSYLGVEISNFKLFVGTRLNPPKFLTKSKN